MNKSSYLLWNNRLPLFMEYISGTLVLTNMVFSGFLVISNNIFWSLHFWLWKLLYKISVKRKQLLTNSSSYRTKILVSSSNFIIDLAHSTIFLSFEVYLQLLNHWNLSNFQFYLNAWSFPITLQYQLYCSYITVANCEKWRV